jgi:HD-GYP domain-containing protein (c-di-GMP phosphodiesterase class II)
LRRDGSAITELKRHAGTQFDPEIVQAFCRALESLPSLDTHRHHDPSSDLPAAHAEAIPA